MNKIKTLSILVGILALINIGILAFFLIGKPKGHGPKGNRGGEKAHMLIKEKFGFDDSQMKSFQKSRMIHMETVKILEKQLTELSRSYYTIEVANKKEVRDSLMNEINEVSENIYKSNLKHFDEVREICKPEQLPEMRNFVNGLLNRNEKRERKRGR